MSNRRAVPAIIASAFALLFFGLGNYLGARQTADSDELALMRSEIAQLKRRALEPAGTTGRSADPVGMVPADTARASIVADVKRQLVASWLDRRHAHLDRRAVGRRAQSRVPAGGEPTELDVVAAHGGTVANGFQADEGP